MNAPLGRWRPARLTSLGQPRALRSGGTLRAPQSFVWNLIPSLIAPALGTWSKAVSENRKLRDGHAN
eukprot:2029153-Prymnesium_polylepis.1